MVKKLLANARNMGSTLVREDPTGQGANLAYGPQLLSLCSRAQELKSLSPHALKSVLHNKRSHLSDKPAILCNYRGATTCGN